MIFLHYLEATIYHYHYPFPQSVRFVDRPILSQTWRMTCIFYMRISASADLLLPWLILFCIECDSPVKQELKYSDEDVDMNNFIIPPDFDIDKVIHAVTHLNVSTSQKSMRMGMQDNAVGVMHETGPGEWEQVIR